MRKSVVVKGKTLSREVIEKAYQELQTPEPLPLVVPPHLTRMQQVKGEATMGVLIIGRVQEAYVRGFDAEPLQGRFTVVSETGDGYTYSTPGELLRLWAVTTPQPKTDDMVIVRLTRDQASTLHVMTQYIGGYETSRRGDATLIRRQLETAGINGYKATYDITRGASNCGAPYFGPRKP